MIMHFKHDTRYWLPVRLEDVKGCTSVKSCLDNSIIPFDQEKESFWSSLSSIPSDILEINIFPAARVGTRGVTIGVGQNTTYQITSTYFEEGFVPTHAFCLQDCLTL